MIPKLRFPKTEEWLFYKTFNIPLARFWDYFNGFDIVKFDEYTEEIETLDGMSLKAWLKTHRGKEGAELIQRLIKL